MPGLNRSGALGEIPGTARSRTSTCGRRGRGSAARRRCGRRQGRPPPAIGSWLQVMGRSPGRIGRDVIPHVRWYRVPAEVAVPARYFSSSHSRSSADLRHQGFTTRSTGGSTPGGSLMVIPVNSSMNSCQCQGWSRPKSELVGELLDHPVFDELMAHSPALRRGCSNHRQSGEQREDSPRSPEHVVDEELAPLPSRRSRSAP